MFLYQRQTAGFTLMELLIVIAIVGIFATVAVATIGIAGEKGRDASRLSQADAFANALELYYTEHGHYPYAVAGSPSNVSVRNFNDAAFSPGTTLIASGYIDSIPEDPMFGTSAGNGGCDSVDATGYCYCSGGSGSDSYVLTVELETGARCYIAHGAHVSNLCTTHWGPAGSASVACADL